MVNITNKDIWYALGLSAIFVSGYLSISILHHFLLGPLRKRKLLRRRLVEEQREDLIRAKVFKNGDDTSKSLVVRLLEKVGGRRKIENIQRQLLQADIYCNVAFFLGLVGLLAVTGFIIGQLRGNYLGGAILAVALGALPFFYMRIKKGRKSRLVEKQLPDAMELLARSLRAGHTLPSAIELASQETPYPLGAELRITYEEQRLGIRMAEALQHMVDRVDSRDLRYFVTAVLIQTETGGNLAEIMEKISQLIRDRLKVKSKVRGLTAEGRYSALVLGALPFVMFVLLYVLRKDYVMTLFHEPMGRKMLVAGMIGLSLGALIMKKMIQIKV